MKRELATDPIASSKHLFACLVKQCSQELGIAEPIINWACEYDRSKTHYVVFLFFGSKTERYRLDAADLAALATDASLKQSVIEKIEQILHKFLDSTL